MEAQCGCLQKAKPRGGGGGGRGGGGGGGGGHGDEAYHYSILS